MSASTPAERAYGKILPAVAAVALIGTVVIAGGISGGSDDDASSANSLATTSTTLAAATTTALATTTTAPKTTLSQTLRRGMVGPDVQAVQQRLTDLGFQVGVVDGQFGKLTEGAVWAFETVVEGKVQRDASGEVTPERWLLMQDPLPATMARRPQAGKHTEIYLPQQAIVVYQDATPLFISHISSGELEPPGDDFTKGNEWCEEVTIDPGENGNVDGTEPIKKGVCGNAWTPGGVYQFYRKVEGVRQSRLGGMRNPVYFNYGIAVHGAYEVPDHPASHGCVRIDNSFSETFQQLVNIGEQVYVWDGVEEPEVYGDQSGLWDWNDPNYTTTTTSTTTTVPVTTTTAPVPTTRATTPPVTPAATTVAPSPETTTTVPAPPAG